MSQVNWESANRYAI